ncbi:MAG TPA: molybdopterin-binding/glycosyltransferase family 2 protein [Rhizomicrobium sp.]|nr:molybdopterin-binding/glycosyltransferase family 2 protein [Rhizomicrobium sp.]
MTFGSVPIRDAEGAILAHSVRPLRKGRVLSAEDIAQLEAAGVREVVVARLEPSDIGEDDAASRIAASCAGDGVRIGAAFTGRANLYATAPGLALIDAAKVDALNRLDESITLATLAPFARVASRQMLATIKIVPFAAPRACVEAAAALGEIVKIAPFRPMRVALLMTGGSAKLMDKTRGVIEARLASIGSRIGLERRTSHEIGALAAAIKEAKGCDAILIMGASAIADRRDVVPAAIAAAGGSIDAFGMPVDPGNLLLTARLEGKPVVGLPGCARSPKLNGFDFVLWRIAAGLPVGREEIATMGVGGLLGEIPTRPQPRDERPAALPRIGAVVLAAGRSSRMGANKLTTEIEGKPLVRRAAEAALASAADPVVVVTGHAPEAVRQALDGLDLRFADNPDFTKGLSASLKRGVNALPEDCDGAVVLLGDMPDVSAVLVDRLIAAFDPAENRAICVAARNGRRGNPVLWARRFFPEMLALEGDTGAKALMTAYDELVVEVEAGDDSPLIDLDTQEALDAYRRR